MATVYQINKGVNRSIEFRGIKAQYLIFLALGMVGLLFLCVGAFIAGAHPIATIAIVAVAAYSLVVAVQRYSKRYGEHGLAKKIAQNRMPQYITASSRKIFIHLSESSHEPE